LDTAVRRKIRAIQGIVAVAAVAGSTAVVGGKVAILGSRPQTDPSVEFRVIDARPPADQKNGFLNDLAVDCDYGVYKLGDDRTDPPRMAYLHDYLVNLLGKQLHGKSLEVTRYTMYINRASIWVAELRAKSRGGPDLPDKVKPVMGSRCPPEKMHGGYYADSEVTTTFSPVIIEIEATYDGRKLRVRSVYSPTRELPARNDSHPEDGAEYFVALRDANSELAKRMIDTAMSR